MKGWIVSLVSAVADLAVAARRRRIYRYPRYRHRKLHGLEHPRDRRLRWRWEDGHRRLPSFKRRVVCFAKGRQRQFPDWQCGRSRQSRAPRLRLRWRRKNWHGGLATFDRNVVRNPLVHFFYLHYNPVGNLNGRAGAEAHWAVRRCAEDTRDAKG